MTLTFRTLLLLVAVILFVLAGLGVGLGAIDVIALGLAAFAAAFVVPDRAIDRR